MFSTQRFSLLLKFSLLVLLLVSANKADAQTIEVNSLKSDSCQRSGSNTSSVCTPSSESAGAASVGGSTAAGKSLEDLLKKFSQFSDRGSFLGVEVYAFSKVDGSGTGVAQSADTTFSLGLNNTYTGTLDLDDQSLNRWELSATSSQLAQWSPGKEIFPDPATLPVEYEGDAGEVVVSDSSPLPGEVVLSDSSPLPGEVVLSDSSPLPGEVVVSDSSPLLGEGTFPTPSPPPGEGVVATPNLLGEWAFSNPSTPSIVEPPRDTTTVPEPSISLLAWLGLAYFLIKWKP